MIHFGGEVLSEKLVSESDSSEDLPETDEFSETPQDSTVDNFNLASDSVNLDEITETEGRSVDLMDLSSVKERIENICGILSKWKALDTKRSRGILYGACKRSQLFRPVTFTHPVIPLDPFTQLIYI